MALMTHRTTSSTTLNTTCSSIPSDSSAMPPPTYNHLDAAQRSRLIKSSRKLGKVLGTTPCVLESTPSQPAISQKASLSDMSAKRRSVPPTPTAMLGEFISSADLDSGKGCSRKPSHSSTLSEGGEDDSCSSQAFLTESAVNRSLKHRKASSDTLGPIPIFPDSETSRHKSKRQQPVLRLPPVAVNKPLPSPTLDSPSSLFPPDYKLEPTKPVDAVMTPLPMSPTSSISPSSTDMPPTPLSGPFDPIANDPPPLPDDVLSYPGLGALGNIAEDESRMRKRRMEKLMRHLGECVPSELVFGTSHRPRETMSFSDAPVSPSQDSRIAATVAGRMKEAQSRVMRRVSVISGQRRRTQDESDAVNSGCLSDPEPGNASLIQAMLMRERSRIHIARGKERAKEKPLVEDEWTPEAYEDVVNRLRRLK